MSLKERVYSVLVVSAAAKLNTALSPLMPEARYQPVKVVSSVSSAKRAWSERSYDCVIINSPLPDDDGTRFAVDVSASKGAGPAARYSRKNRCSVGEPASRAAWQMSRYCQ